LGSLCTPSPPFPLKKRLSLYYISTLHSITE
jgi:hypothetical protein